jgi:phage-related protein
MDIVVLHQCEREIKDFPEEIIGDVLDCIAKLRSGIKLSMPLSRPMPSLGKSLHELRLKDRNGQYRVIYYFKVADAIYLVHAFRKKTEQTEQKDINVALRRIKQI